MAQLLRESMSEILLKEGPAIYGNKALVSITHVKVTPDLSLTRFHVSIFNDDVKKVFEAIEEHRNHFKNLLGKEMKNHLRKMPVVEFFLDDTLEQAERINEIFREIEKAKLNAKD